MRWPWRRRPLPDNYDAYLLWYGPMPAGPRQPGHCWLYDADLERRLDEIAAEHAAKRPAS